MEFKYWIEGKESPSAAYQRIWAPHFQAISPLRKGHFDTWFPEGQERIYLPITLKDADFSRYIGEENKRVKDQIQKVFTASQQFQIIDWKKGLASDNRKNQWKIAKAIEALSTHPQNWGHPVNLSELRDDYLGLKLRVDPINNLMIAISKDVHDIAKMSTTRGWENCNTLSLSPEYGERQATGEDMGIEYIKMDVTKDQRYSSLERTYVTSKKHGITTPTRVLRFSYQETVDWLPDGYLELAGGKKIPTQDVDAIQSSEKGKGYDFDKLSKEIIEGGLIAYLIEPDDKEIKRPYGRIMLRRYENPATGTSMLVCSEGVAAGVASQIMEKFLQKWLSKKQGNLPFGRYHKTGGSWISGDKYDITVDIKKINKRNEAQILKTLEINDWSEKDHLLGKILDKIKEQGLNTVSKKFWKALKKIILGRSSGDYVERKFGEIIKANPDAVSMDELLPLKNSEVRNILQGSSLYYQHTAGNLLDQFKTVAKDKLEQLLNSNNKIDVSFIKKVIDHIDAIKASKEDPNLLNRLADKAMNVILSKDYSDEEKKQFVMDVVEQLNYGMWKFGNQPIEIQKKWYETINKLIGRAIPYLGMFDAHVIKSFINSSREMGVEPDLRTLKWLSEFDI